MPTAATIGRTFVVAFAFLISAAPAGAKDQVKVTGVSVGFPSVRDGSGVAKFGTWAPVDVQLEVLGTVTEPAELVIEAPDADEITTTFTVPIDLAGGARRAIGYVRPGGASSEITVTVRTAQGSALSEPFRVRVRPREPLQYIVLALGGLPAGFELPKPATAPAEAGSLRAGRVELAHIGDTLNLPDRWFGYEGADLVVLNTGSAPDFLKQLFGSSDAPNKQKREALLEWVRRGGRFVISVGTNAALAAQLPVLKPLLPYVLKADAPSRPVEIARLVWSAGAGQANTTSGALGGRGRFPMANLVPQSGRAAHVLIPPLVGSAEEAREPVVVQSALGLGRVTVVGFDLDGSPFAEFPARPDFWDFVLRECGANRPSSGGEGRPRPPGALTEDEDSATVAVRVHNDTFDGIPVVSFGWVALLIVVYILIIGPVEYYILKRLVGRLELTWITFPIIVVTASALAYVSAAAVKGRDLKVNKLDVVDVDPASNRLYGTTWFTVFSPRIDSYSIGVTPGDGWAQEDQPEDTTVTSIGAPRAGRAGLTRRKYAVGANGLESVPIQVWSTKAFSANWSARLDAEPGLGQRFTSNLSHPPGDRTKVIGTFRHNLPLPELTDCIAFYAGNAYPLPGKVIVRGGAVRLLFDQGVPATQWLQKKGNLDPLLSRDQAYAERPGQKNVQRQQLQVFTGPLPLMGMLFHESSLKNDEGVTAGNASLRRLDQSWRLAADNRDEVIVVGCAAPPIGPAEDVLAGPNAPAKLWLKGLPGSGARPRIVGTARQETWVRFYVPVR